MNRIQRTSKARIRMLLAAVSLIAGFAVNGWCEVQGTVIKKGGKGDAAKGKEAFEANCAICHNADSEEDKVGPGLNGISKNGAHKLSDGTEHKDHSAAVLRKQTVEGGGSMPPVGASLSDQEVDDLLAYLQTL